ncbi:uncharacterized protein [Henckelia pumila]|uniref:uncharacterized protein n=1 Tax=Henckelia pumila TaxID=405737 RepID=UPI003C6E6FB4
MKLRVTTVKYAFLVNDQSVGPLNPERGLRQGDPLSPYLFILCTEGLTTLLRKAEESGQLHGTKVCRGAPAISHLFFADDSMFLFRTNAFEGQNRQGAISSIMGVSNALDMGSWKKLCIRKEFGGLVFRDFYGFNLAMLGKQGWKLINDPNATICRIYKAKYYPTGDFLNANQGNNPSFAWSSILASQVLIRGYRWRIGDGSTINIWKEPWLRDHTNFYVSLPMIPDLHDWFVKDLMIPGSREWDHDLIGSIFGERDVQRITKIPL